jgi:adenylate cyclase
VNARGTLVLRSLGHYLAMGLLLVVFGRQVCPFIACLSHEQLGRVVAGALAAGWAVRTLAEAWVVRRVNLQARPFAQFRVELGAVVLAAATVTGIDRYVHGFPIGSGLKLAIGFLTLGFAASLDLALARERRGIRDLLARPADATLPTRLADRPMSVSRAFASIAGTGLVLATADVVLLALHDLSEGASMMVTRRELVTELVFVAVVTSAYGLLVVLGWSRNLRLLFEAQVGVLENVAEGRLDGAVPVATRNEFGFIADRTNRMIEGLRDRARVRGVLDKVVEPGVAAQLIASGGSRFASRRNLVILFMDLRGFTAYSEHADAERLMSDLNRYFSAMVAVIRRHRGIVDKFMGDGMLVLFGMDRREGAEADAVRCALAIRHAVEDTRQDVALPLDPGIGIHAGEVIAGVAGAESRFEFTVIGDVVNTASRLESMTKARELPLVVSAAVHAALPEDLRALPWLALGDVALAGRLAPVNALGLK